MNFCRPHKEHRAHELMTVATPLCLQAWEEALAPHPDRAFARYLCDGLQFGFRIGFKRGSPLRSASSNMESARQHPEVIHQYLHNECSLGRMLGPFPTSAGLPPLHFNRIGVIPKGHNTGKWRLITDLSFPQGQSVNDGIDATLCSMVYITVDKVATLVACLGKGSLLAKIDIEAAYRLVPIHPQDRVLQAVHWQEQVFIDPMLPFGLSSAPKIFNALADALNWILQQAGIPYVFHYLDDYILIGPPNSPTCQTSLVILHRVCDYLHIPLAAHKQEGPNTCLVFMGILVDTLKGELRLPAEKLQRLEALLRDWGDRKSSSRKELESLIGHLNHACKVVRSGRSFLRRMLDLLHSTNHHSSRFHYIRLNTGFRSDLAWWRTFLESWNGVSFLAPPSHLPKVELTTDASGSWGCGAWHLNSWFQLQWDVRSHPLYIAEKELLPIILACDTWGSSWRGKQVLCHCDNQTVVACLRSRSSPVKGIMHLLRCLVLLEAHYQCHFYPTYIGTKANHLADDLSRDHVFSFLSKVPDANLDPSPVSPHLLSLLLDRTVDWTSPTWSQLFNTTTRRV